MARMGNTSVNLTIRLESRYYRVVTSRNGRIKPDWIWVADRQEHHPDRVYYLDWYEGGKRKRKAVGRDAMHAQNMARQKELERKSAPPEALMAPIEPDDPTLPAAIASYLDEIRATKKPKTLAAYALSLEYFAQYCLKAHIKDVERSDLLAYSGHLRDTEELAPRTVHNHFANLVSFLKWAGREKIARKGDWPVYVEEAPETYEPEEINRLIAACTLEESRLFRFFLYSGFREQETVHFTWKDLGASTAAVRHKPQYGWSPKAYKERTVPIPAAFAKELLVGKPAGAKSTDLVFPAPEGGLDKHMLRTLKTVATRAGMDPDTCWLHKFRASFATHALQGGVDLRTVQSWMGHTDLASTMRYLRPARGEKVQAQVEALWA
jgi:integrase/recombinase XerD